MVGENRLRAKRDATDASREVIFDVNRKHPDACFATTLPVVCQEHEDDEAEVVLMSEPQTVSLYMGGLHPKASLFERPIDIESATKQHAELVRMLRSKGIQVYTVQSILSSCSEDYMEYRMELEDMAMKALTYILHPDCNEEELTQQQRYAVSDAYKRTVLEEMSVSRLIDVLMVNPTVELRPTEQNTGMEAKYEYQPLSNLVYTRDQQVTTAKGVIMCRLRTIQRRREVELLTYCLEKIGIPILGGISDPGFLEGGDFFPAGSELCFVGIGLRSNLDGCLQLMNNDWIGTEAVAVVRDDFDQHQDRMHLDSVFNIVGRHTCLLLEDIMGEDSPMRRSVDEYVLDPQDGGYKLRSKDVEFGNYLRQKGFKIIPINREDQLRYGCNVINLGNGTLISPDRSSSRQISRSAYFDGTIQSIDYSSITSMYGAVHCSTQVLKRKKMKK